MLENMGLIAHFEGRLKLQYMQAFDFMQNSDEM